MRMAPRNLRHAVHLACLVLLAACSTERGPTGHYKLGQPYQINGKWYYPEYDPHYVKVGVASWYGADFQGLPTANGEVFDKDEISAAHPTLPLPSIVRVTNLENGRSMDIRVNDRGPFVDDRLIDLSQAAARKLGFENRGLANVRVQFIALADDARGTPPEPSVVQVAAAPASPRPELRTAPPRVTAMPATPAAPLPPVRVASASVTAPVSVTARELPPLPQRPPAPPAGPGYSLPPNRPVQVAALPAAPPVRACPAGDQFIQVGAFGDTARVRTVMAQLGAVQRVRVEPTFVGGRAVARVRLGPVSGPEAGRTLARVQAMGYPSAFLVPAPGARAFNAATC